MAAWEVTPSVRPGKPGCWPSNRPRHRLWAAVRRAFCVTGAAATSGVCRRATAFTLPAGATPWKSVTAHVRSVNQPIKMLKRKEWTHGTDPSLCGVDCPGSGAYPGYLYRADRAQDY